MRARTSCQVLYPKMKSFQGSRVRRWPGRACIAFVGNACVIALLMPRPCMHAPQVRDHALSEHTTLKHLLSDLDSMAVDHPGFNDKMKTIMQVH